MSLYEQQKEIMKIIPTIILISILSFAITGVSGEYFSIETLVTILGATSIVYIFEVWIIRIKRYADWNEISELQFAKMVIPDFVGVLAATMYSLYFFNTILVNEDKITSMASLLRVLYGDPVIGSVSLIIAIGSLIYYMRNQLKQPETK